MTLSVTVNKLCFKMPTGPKSFKYLIKPTLLVLIFKKATFLHIILGILLNDNF